MLNENILATLSEIEYITKYFTFFFSDLVFFFFNVTTRQIKSYTPWLHDISIGKRC